VSTVLLFGSTGQIGSELARTLTSLGKVVAPDRGLCDFTRTNLLGAFVDKVRPDIIVNAAAYTKLDEAEEHPDVARAINATAPAELARAAARHNAVMVHYSTDCVFDGKSSDPYSEDDAPNPLSVYGRSKLAGDDAIRASGADYLILRTGWVFAAQGRNFLRTIVDQARKRKTLRVVTDRIGTPNWARLVAETTAFVLHQDLPRRNRHAFESCTLNVTAEGETSWYGFASAILAAAGELGFELKCRNVEPTTMTEFRSTAVRPGNSRLSGAKLARRYGFRMPDWESCLRPCLAELFSC